MAYYEYIDENGDLIVGGDGEEDVSTEEIVEIQQKPSTKTHTDISEVLYSYIETQPNARIQRTSVSELCEIWSCLTEANMSPRIAINLYKQRTGKEMSHQLMSQKRDRLKRILGR